MEYWISIFLVKGETFLSSFFIFAPLVYLEIPKSHFFAFIYSTHDFYSRFHHMMSCKVLKRLHLGQSIVKPFTNYATFLHSDRIGKTRKTCSNCSKWPSSRPWS